MPAADTLHRYQRQNAGRPLTPAQQRRLRKRERREWGPPIIDEDYGCCALDDAAGSGHEGPCAYICHHCQGTGKCPACDGTGDDGSGLDYTCMECGGGSCPYCDEGMVTDDVH